MSREELKRALKPGDQRKIASLLPGNHKSNIMYVSMVLLGKRKAERGKAKKILELAEAIVLSNKQLEKLASSTITHEDEFLSR